MEDRNSLLLNLKINKVSPIPIYHQVYMQILAFIEQDRLKVNQRLPTEVELARHLDVSRLTVRRAYETLNEEGYLYRIAGKGTFLKDPRQRNVYKDRARTRNVVFLLFLQELDPFFADVLKGIESVLSRSGYNLVLKLSGRHEKESVMEIIENKSTIDGLIWTFLSHDNAGNLIEKINKSRIPLVILESYIDGLNNDFMGIDFAEYNYKLARSLIKKGRKRIFFYSIGHRSYTGYMVRIFQSFRRAINEAEIDVSQCIIRNDIISTKEGEDFNKVVDNIISLKGRFDSIILNTMYCDPMVYLKLLRQRDDTILRDIDIGVILAETWNQADYDMIPVISHIRRRDFFMGQTAGKRIAQRIDNYANLRPTISLIGEKTVENINCSYMIQKNKKDAKSILSTAADNINWK